MVHIYPHDRTAFTEGLEYHDGFLYESTGLNSRTNPPGHSSLRKVRPETGEVVQRIPIRIRFNKNQPGLDRLRPGMSVEPEIRVMD